ncbi:MAG: hypothetical protein ACYDC6_12430 [Acidobacteriaceae bacterium]
MRPRKRILLYGLDELAGSIARVVLDARGYTVRTAADKTELLRTVRAAGIAQEGDAHRVFALWLGAVPGADRDALVARCYTLARGVRVLGACATATMREVLDELRGWERSSPRSHAIYALASKSARASCKRLAAQRGAR